MHTGGSRLAGVDGNTFPPMPRLNTHITHTDFPCTEGLFFQLDTPMGYTEGLFSVGAWCSRLITTQRICKQVVILSGTDFTRCPPDTHTHTYFHYRTLWYFLGMMSHASSCPDKWPHFPFTWSKHVSRLFVLCFGYSLTCTEVSVIIRWNILHHILFCCLYTRTHRWVFYALNVSLATEKHGGISCLSTICIVWQETGEIVVFLTIGRLRLKGSVNMVSASLKKTQMSVVLFIVIIWSAVESVYRLNLICSE